MSSKLFQGILFLLIFVPATEEKYARQKLILPIRQSLKMKLKAESYYEYGFPAPFAAGIENNLMDTLRRLHDYGI